MSKQEQDALPAREGPIRQVLAPIRGRLWLAGTLAACGAVLGLAPLVAVSTIGQQALGVGGITADAAWRIAGLGIAALFAGMTMSLLGDVVAHLADNRITGSLRLAIARRLSRVPLGWFSSRSSGEVKQAMQDDIGTLHSLTAHFYTTLGRCGGAVAASILYLLWLDWRMALVALLPYPLFFAFTRSAYKRSAANMQQFGAGMARINHAVVEFVNGMPVVKAFGGQRRARHSYAAAIDEFANAFTDFTRPLVDAMANANAMISPVSVLGFTLAGGTLFVSQGWLHPADILPFALVAPALSAPLLLLHYQNHDLQHATGAAQRVQALLQTPVLPQSDVAAQPAGAEIRFEQVGYAYHTSEPLLQDISFTLKPGTVTAIVGSSGAGKSTIARLLLRFFDPQQGHITLGGADLRALPASTLYRHIGFVLQEVRLIHASVRDNIALGRPTATQAEIEHAAKLANIHERILSLPRAYDSVVGEDALFSGGELQRVSIARAVLLDPPVLVLDEATAAADADNEFQLQQALSRFARGRSVLVIAHRLDTVMHADQILVLDGGKICERGQHGALLAEGGRYARLWAQGHYESGDKPQTNMERLAAAC